MAKTINQIMDEAAGNGYEVHIQRLNDGHVIQVVDKATSTVMEYPYVPDPEPEPIETAPTEAPNGSE